MRKPPTAIRHLIAHRVAFCVVILTAVITASFMAAAVAFFNAVTAGAASTELAGRPGTALVVTAPVTRATARQVSADLSRTIRGLLPGLRPAITVSVQSDALDLPGRTSAARLQTQLISLPGLAAHIVQVAGTCPHNPAAPATTAASAASAAPAAPAPAVRRAIPACLPAAAARVLGLAPGDQVTLRDAITHASVPVLITGTFRLAGAGSPYWSLDPLGTGQARRTGGFTKAGPLVTSPAEAARARFALSSAALVGQPDFARLPGTGLVPRGDRLAARIGTLNSSAAFHDASITTNLPGELLSLATALVVARTKILAGMLTLLVIAGATLGLAARLLAERRQAETALLGARGASRPQIARRCLIDAVVVALPAAIAGPLIGAMLAPRFGTEQASGPTAAMWLAGAAVALGCAAVIALPWLRRPPSPLRQRASRGRQRSLAAAAYARADLAVVLIAAAAVWQLIRSAGPVSTGLDGSLSADPILVIAPVLALVGGALLTLRLLPVAARLGDRLAARGRGLVIPAAAWQISRRALRQAGPTLVAVLAIAAAVMAVAQRESWQRSVEAQASFRIGADLRVTLPPAAALPLGRVGAIVAAKGVTASTPAVRSSFSLSDGSTGTLLALDGKAAAAIIPAAAGGPAPAVLRRLAVAPPIGVPLPGRPKELRLTATLGRARLGPGVLFAQVMDAAGISYLLSAGPLPADGRPHRLSVTVATRSGAGYPLRLTGFTMQFVMPLSRRPAETLTVSGGVAEPAAGNSARSGSGTTFRLARPGLVLRSSASQGTGGTEPRVIGLRATSAGSLIATFRTGDASKLITGLQGVTTRSAGIFLAESYPGAARPVPAVVTRGLLAAAGLHLGDRMQIGVDGATVQITAVAAVRHIPSVTGGSPTVLLDQRALGDALQAVGAPPQSATEWWLRTSGRPVLPSLPSGTVLATRAHLARALLADPLSRASQQALLAIAVAAVLLALIGMLVSAATAAERRSDLVLLDALGMPPGQVARLVALEQAMTAVATGAVGVLFGAALSTLIIPADTLTAQAARPVPSVAVQLPWLIAALTALAVAAVPTVAVTLTSPRRASGAAMTRLEEQT